MADIQKLAAAETTARDNQASEPQQQQQESEPSKTAEKSIEMEDLSTANKSTALGSLPVENSTGNGQTTTITTNAESTEQNDSKAPQLSTSEGGAVSGPSDTSGNVDGDAQPLKSQDEQGTTPAPIGPEQQPLSINPADPAGEETSPSDPVVDIMLIVTQSNSRHPFRISEKYLTKRSVAVPGLTEDGRLDPMSITVYTLKELILRDWRKEWEAPPREPVSIRLIYFGKMLEDKLPLSHYNFSHNAKNVVHMTVKPQEIIDEEEANKKVKDSGSSSRGNGCCTIL